MVISDLPFYTIKTKRRFILSYLMELAVLIIICNVSLTVRLTMTKPVIRSRDVLPKVASDSSSLNTTHQIVLRR